MEKGITSIIARKGERPTKGREVISTQEELMRVQLPTKDYTTAIRMYKESFCVEIWRTDQKAPSNGQVWALILTTRDTDSRLSAVKNVWEAMRTKFQKMSLKELEYTNLYRETKDLARDLPVSYPSSGQSRTYAIKSPPYEFRAITVLRRKEHTAAHVYEIPIPGRDPWVFTNALAEPLLVKKVNAIISGADEVKSRGNEARIESEREVEAGPSADQRFSTNDNEEGDVVVSDGSADEVNRRARGGRGRSRGRSRASSRARGNSKVKRKRARVDSDDEEPVSGHGRGRGRGRGDNTGANRGRGRLRGRSSGSRWSGRGT